MTLPEPDETVAERVTAIPRALGLGVADRITAGADSSGSEREAVVLAGIDPLPPVTVAVLVMVAGASAATFTQTESAGNVPPTASVSDREHVKVAGVHVQPRPVIAVAARLVASPNVTFTAPVVG